MNPFMGVKKVPCGQPAKKEGKKEKKKKG